MTEKPHTPSTKGPSLEGHRLTTTYRPATQWITRVEGTPNPTAEEIRHAFLTVIDAAQDFAAKAIATHSGLYETMQLAKPTLVNANILAPKEADALHKVAEFIRTLIC